MLALIIQINWNWVKWWNARETNKQTAEETIECFSLSVSFCFVVNNDTQKNGRISGGCVIVFFFDIMSTLESVEHAAHRKWDKIITYAAPTKYGNYVCGKRTTMSTWKRMTITFFNMPKGVKPNESFLAQKLCEMSQPNGHKKQQLWFILRTKNKRPFLSLKFWSTLFVASIFVAKKELENEYLRNNLLILVWNFQLSYFDSSLFWVKHMV